MAEWRKYTDLARWKRIRYKNFFGHEIAFPIYDDTKIFGHLNTNPVNGKFFDDKYDFDHHNGNWYDLITHLRNYLTDEAIQENGRGDAYWINIYDDDCEIGK